MRWTKTSISLHAQREACAAHVAGEPETYVQNKKFRLDFPPAKSGTDLTATHLIAAHSPPGLPGFAWYGA